MRKLIIIALLLSGCAAHRPARATHADTVDADSDDADDDSDVIEGTTQADLERAAKDALARLYRVRDGRE